MRDALGHVILNLMAFRNDGVPRLGSIRSYLISPLIINSASQPVPLKILSLTLMLGQIQRSSLPGSITLLSSLSSGHARFPVAAYPCIFVLDDSQLCMHHIVYLCVEFFV